MKDCPDYLVAGRQTSKSGMLKDFSKSSSAMGSVARQFQKVSNTTQSTTTAVQSTTTQLSASKKQFVPVVDWSNRVHFTRFSNTHSLGLYLELPYESPSSTVSTQESSILTRRYLTTSSIHPLEKKEICKVLTVLSVYLEYADKFAALNEHRCVQETAYKAELRTVQNNAFEEVKAAQARVYDARERCKSAANDAKAHNAKLGQLIVQCENTGQSVTAEMTSELMSDAKGSTLLSRAVTLHKAFNDELKKMSDVEKEIEVHSRVMSDRIIERFNKMLEEYMAKKKALLDAALTALAHGIYGEVDDTSSQEDGKVPFQNLLIELVDGGVTSEEIAILIDNVTSK